LALPQAASSIESTRMPVITENILLRLPNNFILSPFFHASPSISGFPD